MIPSSDIRNDVDGASRECGEALPSLVSSDLKGFCEARHTAAAVGRRGGVANVICWLMSTKCGSEEAKHSSKAYTLNAIQLETTFEMREMEMRFRLRLVSRGARLTTLSLIHV